MHKSRQYDSLLIYRSYSVIGMAAITAHDDIFTLRAPDRQVGDIIDILDANNVSRRVRLTIPMADEFAFEWADPAPTPTTSEATFTKQGDEWLIRTNSPKVPGDRVQVSTQKGTQEHILGEAVGDNLFRPRKNNHFLQNPTGNSPKWCVRVYDAGVSAGTVIEVAKKDGSTQKQRLIQMVAPGIWSATKV